MHIAIVSLGTRGDCQPYVALAKALSIRGHEVTIICNKTHENLFNLAGIARFIGLDQDIDAFMRSKEFLDILTTRDALSMMDAVRKLMEENWTRNAETTLRHCKAADALVSNLSCWTISTTVAEELSIPLIICPLIPPAFVTDEFPPVLMCPYPLPPWLPSSVRKLLTKLMYELLYYIFDFTVGNKKEIQEFRKTLKNVEDLQVHKSAKRLLFRNMFATMLLGYSHTLAPVPMKDWSRFDVHVAGFFRFKHEFSEKLSDKERVQRTRIQDWIHYRGAGAPVFIGFGSMFLEDGLKLKLLRILVRAAFKHNLRLIVQQGWMKLRPEELAKVESGIATYIRENVLGIDTISHDWLFPLCRLIIHHGGAGTTATAMSSGVPQLVLPFGFDQQFWAWRTFDLKLSPGYCSNVLDVEESMIQKLLGNFEINYEKFQKQAKCVQRLAESEIEAAAKGAHVIEQAVSQTEGYWERLRAKQVEYEISERKSKSKFLWSGVALVVLVSTLCYSKVSLSSQAGE